MQEEMEPICIDSDEDDHAPGSGPARETNQNGAALATRHSTRSTRFQSTTQVFKVCAFNTQAEAFSSAL